ncbi:MAG: hypothetical protein ACXADF_14925 [Candidatus Thorarchaeota archaeon]|jgi:hypothetical protein
MPEYLNDSVNHRLIVLNDEGEPITLSVGKAVQLYQVFDDKFVHLSADGSISEVHGIFGMVKVSMYGNGQAEYLLRFGSQYTSYDKLDAAYVVSVGGWNEGDVHLRIETDIVQVNLARAED